MRTSISNLRAIRTSAFTLIEVMVAVLIVTIVASALYLSISSGFKVIETARENLRATQIMVEHMEIVRLYHWDQATNSAYVPSTFTNNYNHLGTGSLVYKGTISVAPLSSATESYAPDLRQITVNLTWTSGGVQRSRSMQSLVAKRGIQNYVY